MSRPKGLPKTGGRKPGTPNRDTQALIDRLEALGCDPIEGLSRIAIDPATTTDLKVRCLAELAQYVYPKRKAVDVGVDDGRSWHVTIEHIGQPQTSPARDSIVRPREAEQSIGGDRHKGAPLTSGTPKQ